MKNLDKYDLEFEEIQRKRKEYLTNCKKGFECHLEGFFFVDDGMIPEEFEQCLCVLEEEDKYHLMIGIWDKSSLGCLTDSRGSFFDGIGGHFSIDDIIAWCPIDSSHIKYIFKNVFHKNK